MQITDPRSVSTDRYPRALASLLNDPRDTAFFGVMLQCGAIACAGIALFFSSLPLLYTAPLYWVGVGLIIDRFTLMLHCTSHRPLFRSEYRILNQIIPWLLGPFFGQTPSTYFAHHMGMHHREENLADDLSSTMPFRRDRFDHWLRYWFRFSVIGLVELCQYFWRRDRRKLFVRTLVGEGTYWTSVALLMLWQPWTTFVVFVGPLLAIRVLMMAGNWAQHAFVCAANPEDPYRASITCINTRYNRRCFNDGYHVLHHVKPRCHWTEHPIEFEKNLAEYGRRDAVVFEGLDFFQVWLCLMLRRWTILASRFQILPGAPVRSRDEIIAFLRERVGAVASASARAPEARLPDAA